VKTFLAAAKKRNVIAMAGLYLVGAWLLIEFARTMRPGFGAPAWVLGAIIIALAIGSVPARVLVCVFAFTPAERKAREDAAPHQS